MTELPSVFVSHGAPTMLLQEGPTQAFFAQLGATLPRPRAVLCISAHWETSTPRITGSAAPATIHDFYGFPEALYQIRYPAAGDPELAVEVTALLREAGFTADIDGERGLDHGTWVPLRFMYPRADVPVIQLSLQSQLTPRHHLDVGRALRSLRTQGVLIVGSGGATHDLSGFRRYAVDASATDYALAFDRWLKDAVNAGDTEALLNYTREAPQASRNHPTPEHFLPLFAPLGAAGEGARGRQLHAGFTYGALSMAAYVWEDGITR
jgi:4,5-DOPA dioxygenase extradiol